MADAPLIVERLRRRADFVATAKGARVYADAFGLQMRRRDATDAPPRFGLTVTKKTAPRAVDRNRMRRRLREALRLGAALPAEPARDYVVVGRAPLLGMGFDDLKASLAQAIAAISREKAGGTRNRKRAR